MWDKIVMHDMPNDSLYPSQVLGAGAHLHKNSPIHMMDTLGTQANFSSHASHG